MSFSSSADYVVMRDAMAMSAAYDLATGASTYRPVNVNGNYRLGGHFRVSAYLDKKRRANVYLSLQPSYARSVDLNRAAGDETAGRSSVKTRGLAGWAGFSINKVPTWSFNVSSYTDYKNVAGTRADFTQLKVWTLRQHASVSYDPVERLHFWLSCGVSTQTGYSDASLNFTNVLLDASASYSFFKGKMRLELRTNDLLHQNRSAVVRMNEQGRYETTYNLYLPPYVMLKIAWRLNSGGER